MTKTPSAARAVKAPSPWIDGVVREYRRGLPLALFFDYDGTLTPIVSHPSLARLAPATRERLHELAALPRVGVGIISGRALDDLRSMVALEGVYYAGSGGLEIDHLGRIERCPETDSMEDLLESIEEGLIELLSQYPGTWLERKPGALALHFRGLLPLAACFFRLDAVRFLSGLEGVRFRIVSQAVEVTPQEGWDKGTAVVSILKDMQSMVATIPLAIYFGDSANDAEGMTATLQTGGVAVGIGAEAPPVAVEQLSDASQLGGFLDELTDRLAGCQESALASRAMSHASDALLEEAPVAASRVDHHDTEKRNCEPEDRWGLLVLDADFAARTAYAVQMSELGWKVWQASTAKEAADLLVRHRERIQVAQVDLLLPGLQGGMAMAAIGRDYPHILRCFVSADVSQYLASAFDRLSQIPLLVKPLRAKDCDLRFRSWLNEKDSRKHG